MKDTDGEFFAVTNEEAEAAGKLVAKQLFQQQEIKTGSVRSLIRRIIDAIKNFFMKLLGISEKRHIAIKEVIIDTPDYEMCHADLKEIYNITRRYKMDNRLKRLPSIKKVFLNEKDDTLYSLNEKIENSVEILSNSRYRGIIVQLNEIPRLAIRPILSPFKKRWKNILLLVILPINIFIYIRSIRFRIKLLIDLTKIETKTREIIKIREKEKLININK